MTNCDTFLPFIFHAVGYFKGFFCLVCNSLLLLTCLFHQRPRQRAKEIIITWLFRGMSWADFQEISRSFSDVKLPTLIRPQALKRLQWHLNQGHRCLLVSASIEDYIRSWAISNGFDSLLASRLEVVSGAITGHFIGRNCRGEEKVRRIEELLGPRDNYILYAYGDSKGDKEMLAMADFAFYQTFPT